MTTSKNTVWVAAAAVLAALLVVATYLLVIAPQRTEAADLTTQAAGVAQSNAQIESETERLKAEFVTLDDKKRELAAIQSTLPAQADVPGLLRQLQGYATTAGVSLTTVTPSSAVAYAPAGTDAAPGTATGVYSIPLSVEVAGSFSGIELYLKNVEADMGRFYLVDGASLTSGAGASSAEVSATITGQVFVYQGGATSAAATTASAGSASSTSGAVAPLSTTTEQ
ncbi:type 4a pilus biogenesis protein PilO [Kineococcus sp. R86509]|uniref:type 4a pilus biogenesis protein PilO n=1 Tax=Kineococcus sp. R86509 TaxID=3093851 RepID=UPI0036D2B35D